MDPSNTTNSNNPLKHFIDFVEFFVFIEFRKF